MKNIETRKYDYIDALRGIAIIGVVIVHASQWIKPNSDLITTITEQGARGVQLFYIASALTLFLSMKSRNSIEKRHIVNFFIRRFFRIAPAFYIAIIIHAMYSGMSERYWAPEGIEWWHIGLTGLFLHGWHPETINSIVPGGWSIAVEMTFYLIVPWLYSSLKSIKSTIILLFLTLILAKILSSTISMYLLQYYPETQYYLVNKFTFLWFFSQLPIFILGILLYQIIQAYPRADKNLASLLLIVSIFMFAGFLNAKILPRHLLYGVAFVIFSIALNYNPNKLFVNSITIFIGKLSFSIYLVHFMVIDALKDMYGVSIGMEGDAGFTLGFIIVITLSVCISYISYKVVEIPGIRFGKYIIKSLDVKQVDLNAGAGRKIVR